VFLFPEIHGKNCSSLPGLVRASARVPAPAPTLVTLSSPRQPPRPHRLRPRPRARPPCPRRSAPSHQHRLQVTAKPFSSSLAVQEPVGPRACASNENILSFCLSSCCILNTSAAFWSSTKALTKSAICLPFPRCAGSDLPPPTRPMTRLPGFSGPTNGNIGFPGESVLSLIGLSDTVLLLAGEAAHTGDRSCSQGP
jgi:hypothetical protein